jgi:hypothetical protein
MANIADIVAAVVSHFPQAQQEAANALLARVPESQRPAAATLLSQYGPQFLDLATDDAMQCLRRLMAGDLSAAVELDSKLSDAQWLARVAANTAAWEGVAEFNKARADLRQQIAVRIAAAVASLLLALVFP